MIRAAARPAGKFPAASARGVRFHSRYRGLRGSAPLIRRKLGAQPLQRLGGVEAIKHNLDHSRTSIAAAGAIERGVEFLFGRYALAPTATEDLRQPMIRPRLDVVVGALVDHPLGRVAVVIHD